MIPLRRVFEDLAGEYDRWFDEHGDVYHAQVKMLRGAVPDHGCGLELGGRVRTVCRYLSGIHCGIHPGPRTPADGKAAGN